MSAKQKGSSTSTQETTYPQYVTDAQNMLSDWRSQYFQDGTKSGGLPVAGMTPAQQTAGSWINALATDPQKDYAQSITAAGGPVTGEQIVEGINPFLDSVGRGVLTDLRRERDTSSAQIGARNANSVAFGGSGPALERAQLNRGHGEQVGSTINSLLAGGYDRSSQLAEGNANRALSAATAAGGQASNQLNTRANNVNSLLQYGTLQQAQEQSQMDKMRSLLDWYGSGQPGVGATTTNTTPNQDPGFLQSLLGGALTIGGMAVGGPAGGAGGTLLGNFLSGKK